MHVLLSRQRLTGDVLSINHRNGSYRPRKETPMVREVQPDEPVEAGFLPRHGRTYQEGQQAYWSGMLVDSCPYPIGNFCRQPWMTGFMDERTRDRLGHIFKRNNLEWP